MLWPWSQQQPQPRTAVSPAHISLSPLLIPMTSLHSRSHFPSLFLLPPSPLLSRSLTSRVLHFYLNIFSSKYPTGFHLPHLSPPSGTSISHPRAPRTPSNPLPGHFSTPITNNKARCPKHHLRHNHRTFLNLIFLSFLQRDFFILAIRVWVLLLSRSLDGTVSGYKNSFSESEGSLTSCRSCSQFS